MLPEGAPGAARRTLYGAADRTAAWGAAARDAARDAAR
jgi:hypothetical protein